MRRDDRKSAHVELPVEVHEAIQEEDDHMWEVISEAVRVYLGVSGDSLTALMRQRERLDEQIAEYDSEIQQLTNEREDLVAQRNRIDEKIEAKKSERREYDTIIDDIIGELKDNPNLGIDALRSELKTAAEIRNDGRITKEELGDVREDVRSRVDARNENIEPERLQPDLLAAQTDTSHSNDGSNLRSVMEDHKNDE